MLIYQLVLNYNSCHILDVAVSAKGNCISVVLWQLWSCCVCYKLSCYFLLGSL